MFNSVSDLIQNRLGKLIILDHFSLDEEVFLLVENKYLATALFFLKNDPDTRLNLLDQIVAVFGNFLPWPKITAKKEDLYLLYQLKSLRLPYSLTAAIKVTKDEPIMSIKHLYLGAQYFEEDFAQDFSLVFDESL